MSILFRPPRVPKYRHYKPKDLAVVRIAGHDHYLGKYGSHESKRRYDELVGDFLKNGRAPAPQATASNGYPHAVTHSSQATVAAVQGEATVDDVILAYWRYAVGYYRKHGRPTGETDNIRAALRPLRQLFGCVPASQLSTASFEAVRDAMIGAKLSRKVVNARINRIKRMFRWASSSKLVPQAVAQSACMLVPLKFMRCDAKETRPVKPVSDEHVEAVLPYLLPQTRAMVQVQLLTGMRPQDVRNLRTCDIDLSGSVWVYEPWTHKCEHYGQERQIAIGPRAQEILRPFLKSAEPERFIFSPKDAVLAWRMKRRKEGSRAPAQGQTKREPIQAKRRPGEQYTKSSYEAAIWRACRKAKIPRWGPNRLRHACGTKVRKKYGIEGAAAVLGNGLGLVTEVYAEKAFELAIKIAGEMG